MRAAHAAIVGLMASVRSSFNMARNCASRFSNPVFDPAVADAGTAACAGCIWVSNAQKTMHANMHACTYNRTCTKPYRNRFWPRNCNCDQTLVRNAHKSMHARTCTHTCTHMHTHTAHTPAQKYTYTHMHKHAHLHASAHMHAHVRSEAHPLTCARVQHFQTNSLKNKRNAHTEEWYQTYTLLKWTRRYDPHTRTNTHNSTLHTKHTHIHTCQSVVLPLHERRAFLALQHCAM